MRLRYYTLGASVFMISYVIVAHVYPTDSTDKNKWDRSGLAVYTDNATGVQYVKAGFCGGITPRVHPDGKIFQVKQ